MKYSISLLPVSSPLINIIRPNIPLINGHLNGNFRHILMTVVRCHRLLKQILNIRVLLHGCLEILEL